MSAVVGLAFKLLVLAAAYAAALVAEQRGGERRHRVELRRVCAKRPAHATIKAHKWVAIAAGRRLADRLFAC